MSGNNSFHGVNKGTINQSYVINNGNVEAAKTSEEIFLNKFMRLTHEYQVRLIAIMDQMEMDLLDQRCQRYGISEEEANYKVN